MPDGFNVGDVVQLKSGGPLMTVTAAEEPVLCLYFDDKNAQHYASVPGSALKKIPPSR